MQKRGRPFKNKKDKLRKVDTNLNEDEIKRSGAWAAKLNNGSRSQFIRESVVKRLRRLDELDRPKDVE